MKKTLKRIIAICLVVAFAFSLSGCTMEKLKANRATWNEDNSITWQGSKYVFIEASDDIDLDVNFSDSISVTNTDVPLLLSDILGEIYYVTYDGKILYDFTYSYLYCREDSYDEISQALAEYGKFTKYFYAYYGENVSLWGTRYYLTEAETEVIENIFAEAQFAEITHSEVWYSDDYTYISELMLSTDEGFYTKYIYDFIRTEDELFFLSAEIFGANYDDPIYHIYTVPEKYEEDLLDIFRYTDTEFYSYDDLYF